MSDFENLTRGEQIEVKMNAIVMALKKTLITTPELQKAFEQNYADMLKQYQDSLKSDLE